MKYFRSSLSSQKTCQDCNNTKRAKRVIEEVRPHEKSEGDNGGEGEEEGEREREREREGGSRAVGLELSPTHLPDASEMVGWQREGFCSTGWPQ